MWNHTSYGVQHVKFPQYEIHELFDGNSRWELRNTTNGTAKLLFEGDPNVGIFSAIDVVDEFIVIMHDN